VFRSTTFILAGYCNFQSALRLALCHRGHWPYSVAVPGHSLAACFSSRTRHLIAAQGRVSTLGDASNSRSRRRER
jgi:hypothetical protein